MADSNYFATSLFVSCSWHNTPYLQTHKSTVPPPAPSLHLIQDAMKVHQPGLLTFTYCSFCCADCLHCQMNASSSSRWQQQPPLYIYVELFFCFYFHLFIVAHTMAICCSWSELTTLLQRAIRYFGVKGETPKLHSWLTIKSVLLKISWIFFYKRLQSNTTLLLTHRAYEPKTKHDTKIVCKKINCVTSK